MLTWKRKATPYDKLQVKKAGYRNGGGGWYGASPGALSSCIKKQKIARFGAKRVTVKDHVLIY